MGVLCITGLVVAYELASWFDIDRIWPASVVMLVGVGLVVKGRWWDVARGRVRCPGCWYDMGGAVRAVARVCPECGRAVESEEDLKRSRRNWLVLVAGIAMFVGGAGWAVVEDQGAIVAVSPRAALVLGAGVYGPAWDELNRRAQVPGFVLWAWEAKRLGKLAIAEMRADASGGVAGKFWQMNVFPQLSLEARLHAYGVYRPTLYIHEPRVGAMLERTIGTQIEEAERVIDGWSASVEPARVYVVTEWKMVRKSK